jgi:hypothetical protein
MRHRTLFAAAAALALPLFAGGVRAEDDENAGRDRKKVFRATLLGVNEVPPVSTVSRGSLRIEISDDETSFDFRLTYTPMEVSPAAVAHVHFAPTKVNGGVMFFMCGGPASPPTNPCPASGTVTGTITAADVLGPAGQGIAAGEFAEVLRAIRGGNAYANIHNPPTNPGGHIRGQLR